MSKKYKILVGILAMLSIGLSGYLWHFNTKPENNSRDLKTIISAVEKLIILPQGEEPVLAIIDDKTKVTEAFLKQAENGDQVLIYYNAGQAYIYRPSENRIISVGQVTIEPYVGEVKGTRITIRNGSNQVNSLKMIEAEIREKYTGVESIKTENASRKDFPSTIVIDLTSDQNKQNLLLALASDIGGQPGVLPLGESSPDSDILIIIGNDQP